jgi:hypothetical protein
MPSRQPNSSEFDFERERLDRETEQARRSAELEEKRLRLDQTNRWWTPVSIAVPLITLIITTYLASVFDQTQAG